MGWLYLMIAIVLGTIFASFYKVAHRQNCDLVNVNTMVYVGGTALMILAVPLMQREPIHLRALLIGAGAGIAVYLATASFFYVMMNRHLSTAWTVISLSVMVPILASIVIYKEYPHLAQWLGLLLMCLALISISMGRSGDSPRKQVEPLQTATDGAGISAGMGRFLFFISFLFSGVGAIANKVLSEVEGRTQVIPYLIALYGTGAVIAVVSRAWRSKNYHPKDAWVGSLMGMAGAASTLALVIALTYLPGIIIFPARACLNLLLTAAVGLIVWRERPGFGGVLGIILGAAALVLINLKL